MKPKKELILEATIRIIESISKLEDKTGLTDDEDIVEATMYASFIIDALCLSVYELYNNYDDYPWHFIYEDKSLSTSEKINQIKQYIE